MSRFQRRRVASCVVALSLLVASCGGDDDDAATGGGSTTATTVGSIQGPDTTAADSGNTAAAPTTGAPTDFDPDATILVGTNEWDTWDPAATTAGSASRWLMPVYDSLVKLERDGSYSPMLATSWEFVTVNGSDALQLKLREGVTFHDGTPFDAEVVKANYDRNLANGAAVLGNLEGVTGVEVVDDGTVNILLEPGNSFGALNGASQTAGRMVSPAAFDTSGDHPIGTGPFIYESITPSQATFVRNDDYWGELPKYKTLVLQSLASDNTPWINGTLGEEIDISKIIGPTESQMSQVESADGVNVEIASSGGQIDHIGFNRAIPPFDDVRVRQAVAYALDYDAINEAQGHLKTKQMTPPWSAVYDETLDEHYTYDPDKARELLAEAGYPDGLDIGELIHTATGGLPQLAQIIQQMLLDVGITSTLRPFERASAVTEHCFGAGNTCTAIVYTSQLRDPLFMVRRQLISSNDNSNLSSEPVTGELADLLDLAAQPMSVEEHDEAVRAVLAGMVEEAISVPIGLAPLYILWLDGIEGVTEGWQPDGHPDYSLLSKAP